MFLVLNKWMDLVYYMIYNDGMKEMILYDEKGARRLYLYR
jgi:hypothetical protein